MPCQSQAVIIGTVHSKSVGKTTLAVHMAAWLDLYEYDVVLVDADWQQQSSDWLAEAAPHIKTHVIQDPSTLVDAIPQLHNQYHVVIVDGPAGLGDTAGAVLLVSDAVLVPCGPTATEIKALKMVAQEINAAQGHRKKTEGESKPGAFIIPIRTHPRRNTTKALLSEAASLGLIAMPAQVPAREIYAKLAGMPGDQSRLLWQLGRSKDVRDAVMDLDALFQQMFPEAAEHDPLLVQRLMSKPMKKPRPDRENKEANGQQKLTVNA